MSRTVLSLIAVLSSSVVIGHQQQTLQSRLLLATVTDTGSRQLFDLGPDDFVVDEGGEPREVLSVHLADYPVALLLDNGVQAREQLGAIRAAASRFVSRAGERPIAVIGLATPHSPLATFDDGRATTLAAIAHLTSASGEPAPLEAAAAAADLIREADPPFSAIVMVSAQPATEEPPEGGRFLGTVLDSGAVVYVVADRRASAVPAQETDLFRVLADQTHGLYTTIYSEASYPFALDRLADRLATQMMIEYVLPTGSTPGGDVRIGVKIPGARANGLGIR